MNQDQNNNVVTTPGQNVAVNQPAVSVAAPQVAPTPVAEPAPQPTTSPVVAPTQVTPEHINQVSQPTVPSQQSVSETVVPQAGLPVQPVSQPVTSEGDKPKKSKSNVPVLVIIIVLLAAIAFGIYYFLLGGNKAKEPEPAPAENVEVSNDTGNENTVKRQLTTVSECQDSETNFNDVTVKLEVADSADNCTFSKVLVNDNDIMNDVLGNIISYEVYDNNLIVLSSDTSGKLLTIYNVTSQSVSTKLRPETMEGYWVDSYTSEEDKLVINGKECGAQCGNELSGFDVANFELSYSDGNFGSPVLVSRMASEEEGE